MTTLVKLTEVAKKPNPDVVTMLRAALAEAEAGDLQYVAIVARRRGADGERLIEISDNTNLIEMLGLFERAKKLCHEKIDEVGA